MAKSVRKGLTDRRGLFDRLATWALRHRRRAVAAWLVVMVAAVVGSQAAGSRYHNDVSLPGTESQRALDLLRQQAPVQAGATIQIVLQDPKGLGADRVQVAAMLVRVEVLPHVAATMSPFARAGTVSADQTVGYATVVLDGQVQDVPAAAVHRIIDTARQSAVHGLRIELAGDAVTAAEGGGGAPAEFVGLIAALLILVLMFGSVLAAGLPVVVAVFAVGTASGLLIAASHVVDVADFTPSLTVLVGLGVGIDYALVLFSRYRSELIAGASDDHAMRTALNTAGRTVLFAGGTVIIALSGLAVLGLGALQGVAVAVALTVLITMLASLTLLPALLAVLSRRIRAGLLRRAAKGGARPAEGEHWRRWAAFVQRRPAALAALGLAAMAALALPAADLRLGIADAGNAAKPTTSRQAYDLLTRGFGPGFNGPLVLVVDGDPAAAAQARAEIAKVAGVAAVVPASADDPAAGGRGAAGKSGAAGGTGESGGSGGSGGSGESGAAGETGGSGGTTGPASAVTTVLVIPGAKPQAAATEQLVTRLRTDVLPALAHRTGATFLIGGPTAATVDFAEAVKSRLALFAVVVIGLSMLLLAFVFRSLVIPLKAALLNLLSVGASLGVVTAVFQHGTLGSLIGVEPGPVEVYVPVMIFAIAFGLSMDYEVFLLSRMREEWDRSHDAPRAIREGIASTGRIVTAAAAIMVVIFASFILDPDRLLKQFGLGLATAVLLDALIIRCLILPAAMQLLGRRAWWLPAGLERWMPHMRLDGSPSTGQDATVHPVEGSAVSGR